eukprot:1161628-Pelagomonas_calceolata.AAC.16
MSDGCGLYHACVSLLLQQNLCAEHPSACAYTVITVRAGAHAVAESKRQRRTGGNDREVLKRLLRPHVPLHSHCALSARAIAGIAGA